MTRQTKQGHAFILSMLASLFFMWGFISVLQDILVPHLRAIFDLNYNQSMLVQFFWFGAYFVMSMPMAFLLQRVGYKRSLVTGLIMMATGALLLVGAGRIANFEAHLFALFVLASGVALLQVAANPYVAVIGPPETSHSRLNLVQAMNTVGDTVAPMFGAWLILSRTKAGTAASDTVLTAADKIADARSVELPYVGIAIVLLLLAAVFSVLKLPDLNANAKRVAREERKKISLWSHRNLVWGVPAIFMCLICEIGVGSLFINFVKLPEIGNMTAADAGGWPLTALWGGMAVGRFVGAWLMRFIDAETVLAGAAIGAFVAVADGGFRERPAGDVCADPGGPVPFRHVPHHLHLGDPRVGTADRGRLGAPDHGDRGRGTGEAARLDRGHARAAGIVPLSRRRRALRAVVCATRQPCHRGSSAGNAGGLIRAS